MGFQHPARHPVRLGQPRHVGVTAPVRQPGRQVGLAVDVDIDRAAQQAVERLGLRGHQVAHRQIV
jgi:hypothetical protein